MERKPAKCKVPKRDRDIYILNKRDLNNLKNILQEACDIVTYYANMPENRTGELGALSTELLEQVQDLAHDFKVLIEDVEYLA